MAAPKPLAGKIVVVAGATRGAGRGIACMLGEAGATVYCTGRSTRESPAATGFYAGRPETIDETAEMVTARGGVGIPVRVDYLVEAEVEALVARIRAEQGRLDVLVNDISEGEQHEWKPFWKLSLEKGFRMFERAVHTHLIACRHAAPLMIERRGGLIVEITDGDTLDYRGTLFYDLVKVTVNRLAFFLAEQLQPHGIAAVAVSPGFMRTETMLDHFGVTEANWRDGVQKDPHFISSETPFFVGRAVAALAADPNVMEKSGGVYASWTLSDEYGFTDIDGNRPHWGRYFEKVFHGQSPVGPPKTAFRWTITKAPATTTPKRKSGARRAKP